VLTGRIVDIIDGLSVLNGQLIPSWLEAPDQ
jgi:hypothetical protein